MHPVKDNLGLMTAGVYSIPCEYGQVYIGQTGSSIEARIKEHHQYI
jgi:predicted GIY-YIG superfamily endonuclease